MAIYSLVHKQLHHALHRIYVYGMLPWPVWTTDPSGCTMRKEGSGENLGWKHLEHWKAAIGVDEGKNTTSTTLTNRTEGLKRNSETIAFLVWFPDPSSGGERKGLMNYLQLARISGISIS